MICVNVCEFVNSVRFNIRLLDIKYYGSLLEKYSSEILTMGARCPMKIQLKRKNLSLMVYRVIKILLKSGREVYSVKFFDIKWRYLGNGMLTISLESLKYYP